MNETTLLRDCRDDVCCFLQRILEREQGFELGIRYFDVRGRHDRADTRLGSPDSYDGSHSNVYPFPDAHAFTDEYSHSCGYTDTRGTGTSNNGQGIR